MTDQTVPMFPKAPTLDDGLVQEITGLVFGHQPPISTIQPCDVIFVFGGVDPGLWRTAIDAYEAKISGDLVVTGGIGHRTPQGIVESELISQHLVAAGIPKAHIFCESKSSNSYENVVFAQEVYDFSPVKRILMVCTSRGIGRQSRTLQQQFKTAEIVPLSFHSAIPGLSEPLTPENWWKQEVSRDYVWGQVLRLHIYGMRGHLKPLVGLSEPLRARMSEHLAQ